MNNLSALVRKSGRFLLLILFFLVLNSLVKAEVEIFLGDEKILVNSNNGRIISSEPVEIATSNIPATVTVSDKNRKKNLSKKTLEVADQREILSNSSLSFQALSKRYFPGKNHTSKRRKSLKVVKEKKVSETFKLIRKRKDLFGKELTSTLNYPEVIINLNRLKNKDNLRFKRALKKLGNQRDLIERLFEKNKIPAELLAIAFVESNFDPKAVSSQNALGMWQFIESTGKFYGLATKEDFFNPRKSSLAAISYLKDLHASLGSWVLAIASYNAGEGRVGLAIKLANGSKNFWEIKNYLPRETQRYVPHVLAAVAIMYEYQIEN